ncbi:MAG TPA: manganese efflux pump [Pseudonocardiaceae bacterium]|nr:manganese efflux pump [Pseudonocardiaceae bacterium]
MSSAFLGLLLFVLPLGVDTFVIAAAVGASRLSGWTRLRTSAIFVIFEGGMPLVGFALGSSIGQAIGGVADYFAGGLLVLLGGYLWWADDDDDEVAKARRITHARGLVLVGLALSISLDELAIGFSFGLGTVPTTIIAVIAIQTLVVSQLGLSLGVRISEHVRECIERLASPILIFLGLYLLTEALIRIELVTTRDAVIVGIIMVIPATLTLYRRIAARTPGATAYSGRTLTAGK